MMKLIRSDKLAFYELVAHILVVQYKVHGDHDQTLINLAQTIFLVAQIIIFT